MTTGFDKRSNLPLDLQAAIPHLVDQGGSRGPQHDHMAQLWLEAVWKASLGDAMQKGWVRLEPIVDLDQPTPVPTPVEPAPRLEPPTEVQPTGLLARLLERLGRLLLRVPK